MTFVGMAMQAKQFLCVPDAILSYGSFTSRTVGAGRSLLCRGLAPLRPRRTSFSRKLCCRSELDSADKEDVSQPPIADEKSLKVTEDCCASDIAESTSTGSSWESPTKSSNRIIALASAAFAVGLFLATRGGLSGATLGQLAAEALPYEQALSNGRPTVVEFYADWCEVCKEMAPEVYKVEQQYKNMVNFVMLNVDNSKWEQELDEFGVEGIPHFAFLDKEGNEQANIVGRLPKKYLEENVVALSNGESKLPHSRVVGQFSDPDSRDAPSMAGPRSHGLN
ncbi:hypothetical protein KP509_29G044400 [Ceratopteris richardii]|uniref:Thioredoxin domain-containing protein n=1 Tax=Ceratopteris richardii TaxID=49495 RepID=A0A8T2R8X8_CERRI|nr:hypothetical protein KP509_29G044400 [Ceratopteris richardii]